MKEAWKVFRDKATKKELLAYTLQGTFKGEEENTIELLAAERGMDPENIETHIEER